MVKKIVWSAKAQNDRKEILQYWVNTNKSATYSQKLSILFNDATNLILKFPKIGKFTNYNNTRVKIVRDYWMVYREYDTQIAIIAIWDSRQNPLKLEKIVE